MLQVAAAMPGIRFRLVAMRDDIRRGIPRPLFTALLAQRRVSDRSAYSCAFGANRTWSGASASSRPFYVGKLITARAYTTASLQRENLRAVARRCPRPRFFGEKTLVLDVAGNNCDIARDHRT